ncbi:MAG: asparagine synthase-related protein, partial [Bryobacteraceae bacterium]
KQVSLRERWESESKASIPNQSARPEAYESMASSFWSAMWEPFDPGASLCPVEVYHPFFDLRVAKFLLSLEVLPWCSDKEILRQAGRGILPDAVRLRVKSPLIRDPILALLQKPEAAWVDTYEAAPELGKYVQRDKIGAAFRARDPQEAWVKLRPLSLNFFLQRYYPLGYKGIGEEVRVKRDSSIA